MEVRIRTDIMVELRQIWEIHLMEVAIVIMEVLHIRAKVSLQERFMEEAQCQLISIL